MPGIGFGEVLRQRLAGLPGGGLGEMIARAGKGEKPYEPPEKGGAPGAPPGGKTLPPVGPVGGFGGVDVVSYLQNPVVLIAVAVGLYFLLKKFKVF